MALTLEASITIPIAVLITIGTIQSAINLSMKCSNEIDFEIESILISTENESVYSHKIIENFSQELWSKIISARPVRLKRTISVAKDSVDTIKGFVPSIVNDEISVSAYE